jgi:hypothetical protein
MHRHRVILLLAAALLASGGCATVKSVWPFGKSRAAAPLPVRELRVEVAADQAMPVVLQFWERNTLVIDMQGASSAGQMRLVRESGNRWPARIAFRMAPARFEALEVRGAQRVVLPVSAGSDAVTVELPPGVHDAGTSALAVRWGAKADL